jgi:adenine-specific DNA-methyltransferase
MDGYMSEAKRNEAVSPERLELESMDILGQQKERLREIFPEAVTEGGKVDFDKLRRILGEAVDEGKERYGLNWAGKNDCLKTIQKPSIGTLLPLKDDSIEFDKTRNIFIEGDNLEVLKLMQKSYLGKIKMIYIDPPYNTGSDFIYPDDYSETLETYLKYTGQVDNEGRKYGSNLDSDGRFHSKWLSMMYPRLFLARNLLSEDGVIFISIDDHEAFNLACIANEIFGKENHIATFVWQAKKGGGSDNMGVVADHEYIFCYGKTFSGSGLGRLEIPSEELDKCDAKGRYRRGRELNKWGANSRKIDRPTMYFAIPGPNGEDVYPIRNDGEEGCWRWGKKKMEAIVKSGDLEFIARSTGGYTVYEKIRSTAPRKKPYRTWLKDVGSTADGSKIVRDLFNGVRVFDFAKPVDLIKQLISIGTDEEEGIVLDFFAGSCTTAQAVLEANIEKGSSLSFICVQLPEPINDNSDATRAGLKTVSEVGRTRIKNFISQSAKENKTGQLNLGGNGGQVDMGYKLFRLHSSNFRAWRANSTESNIQEQLKLHIRNVESSRQLDDLLYEILIKSGFELSAPIQTVLLADKKVYLVHDGVLIICLDGYLTKELITEIAARNPIRVVFLDSAFSGNDQLKVNAVETFKVKSITFKTV